MFFLFLSIVIFLILSLIFSKIQLEIKDFKAILREKETFINPNYKIFIRIYIFGKIRLLNKQIKFGDIKNKKRLMKLKNRLKAKSKMKKGDFKVFRLKNIKKQSIYLKKSNLKIKIDTENAALTAILTGVMYGIIPNFINYFFNLKDVIKYKIQPIYKNRNEISLFFEGIFEINLIHIINTYKVLIGKDKEGKNNGTSNRKSYAYNNG